VNRLWISWFRLRRKLLLLLLLAVTLQGCGGCLGSEFVGTEYYIGLDGFASDTTAIVSSFQKDVFEHRCGFEGNCDEFVYKNPKLMLVDVRFHRIYWEASDDILISSSIKQWDDSTVLLGTNSGAYYLWKINEPKPREVNFKWNTNKQEELASYDLYSWQNDSILACALSRKIIIDSKTMAVSSWDPISEYTWIDACNNCIEFSGRNIISGIWWGKESKEVCLIRNKDSCAMFLLSGNGDTLSSVVYFNTCEKIDGYYKSQIVDIIVYRHFIKVFWGAIINNYYNYYPAPYAMFRYDEKGNIAQAPSFWVRIGGGLEFIDSSENVTRY